jgi:hypothetical protein
VNLSEANLLVFLEGTDCHKSSMDLFPLPFQVADSLIEVINRFLGSSAKVKGFPYHFVEVCCLEGGGVWKVLGIFKSSLISSIGGYSG